MQNRPQPCYYCPPDVPRPAHIRATAPAQLRPEAGPPDAPKGGRTYGAPFEAATGTWHQAPAGWWVHFPEDFLPGDALRVGALPGFLCGPWVCPQIVNVDGTVAVNQRMELDAAGNPVMKAVPELVAMVDFCRELLLNDDDVQKLAAECPVDWLRLVEVNYHLTAVELTALNWGDTNLGEAFLKAGCGIDPNISADILTAAIQRLEDDAEAA